MMHGTTNINVTICLGQPQVLNTDYFIISQIIFYGLLYRTQALPDLTQFQVT